MAHPTFQISWFADGDIPYEFYKIIIIYDIERWVTRLENMKEMDLDSIDQRVAGHECEIMNIIGSESIASNIIENKGDLASQPLISNLARGFKFQVGHAENGSGTALHSHETEEVLSAKSSEPTDVHQLT